MTNKQNGDLIINGEPINYSGSTTNIKERVAKISCKKATNQEVIDKCLKYSNPNNTTDFQYGDSYYDNVYFEIVDQGKENIIIHAYKK